MRRNLIWGLALAVSSIGSRAHASFHAWGISEIYSNSSGSVQFIEMATSAPSEIFMQFNQFTSNAKALEFDHNFGASTAGKKFLMATPGYAALSGVPAPDFIFPSNNFFVLTGDTLTLVGGIGDGTHPPTFTLTNGQVPADGIQSLNFDLTLNPVNSPTNFAGATGSVPEPATAAMLGLVLPALLVRRRQPARRLS